METFPGIGELSLTSIVGKFIVQHSYELRLSFFVVFVLYTA